MGADFTPAQNRDFARWYPLKDHAVQNALVRDQIRFKVVPAGRRSGKTERAKRFLVKTAMSTPGQYFAAAPTREHAKRIWWNDLKRLSLCSFMPLDPRESDLIIPYVNGSHIHVIGLDKPERIEGSLWDGGVIDEIAETKENAWEEHISPALDTVQPTRPDYRAWCWLIGVPDGLNHYFDLAERARSGDHADWALYHWKSADILPPDVIDAAKSRLSPRQYRQEYEATFEGATGRVYENYGPHNHTRESIAGHEKLMWFHDFNFTPLSSGIGVRRGNALYCLEEIVLESAKSRQSALEFVDRYKRHENKSVIVYGDPAGRAGEKHGHASDYTEMEQVLRGAGWKVQRKVKKAAPAIKDRQNAVSAKILNAKGETSLYVHPMRSEYLHKGLSRLQLMPGSTFQEQVSDFQHITTAVGYCVDYEWPVVYKEKVEAKPQRAVSHWGKAGR